MTDYKNSTPDWVKGAIFYEIFPDRFARGQHGVNTPGIEPWGGIPTRTNYFGGDLQGIIDHLGYLEDLGVTALYLTPIFKAYTNHKYDAWDYMSIDPAFGNTELLSKLVTEAHKRGIRIILDAVFNHCGDGFWAFEDIKRNGAASRYASWYSVKEFPLSKRPLNYQTCGGVWFMPKLNTDNPEVQEYLVNVATYWIQTCGIDGWRLDMPWKVPMSFWKLFRERVKLVKPDAYIVGEIWRNPDPWLEGDTCDGVMNYPLRNNILDYIVFNTMDAEDFDYELNLMRLSQQNSANFHLNLLGSHDTPRILTLCKNDPSRLIQAITFLFTYIGAPTIYYGDEVGLLGENDPDCRRCMPWDEAEQNRNLLQIYKKLIYARKSHKALIYGDFIPLYTFNGIFTYLRQFENDEVIVILNTGEDNDNIQVPLKKANSVRKTWYDILEGRIINATDTHLLLPTLPSRGTYILIPDRLEA